MNEFGKASKSFYFKTNLSGRNPFLLFSSDYFLPTQLFSLIKWATLYKLLILTLKVWVNIKMIERKHNNVKNFFKVLSFPFKLTSGEGKKRWKNNPIHIFFAAMRRSVRKSCLSISSSERDIYLKNNCIFGKGKCWHYHHVCNHLNGCDVCHASDIMFHTCLFPSCNTLFESKKILLQFICPVFSFCLIKSVTILGC